ncbi:MAG TPA: MGMT family protein [Rhodanobacteraceae bacterium]|nr:MGMT family protein [Rhodanobacteraceae bacterium]
MKSGDPKRRKAGTTIDPSAIVETIRSIPEGSVASYGELAERAGLPGRARLVGRILGEMPDAKLPWHRVLRSDGRIAFPPGSRSFREQVRRLAGEGVLVVRGRVDLSRHGWDRNLDAALWAPPPVKKSPKPARRRAPSRPKS